MSAIDTTFHWVRNPTILNSLATTYVSKRGSDVTGDGTAQNPYASIAKATAMATANTNIMLDDGEWSEARTANNRAFNWWGNANTQLFRSMGSGQSFHFLYLQNLDTGRGGTLKIYNCIGVLTSTNVLTTGLIEDSVFFLSNSNAWNNMTIRRSFIQIALGSDTFGGCDFIDCIILLYSFNTNQSRFINCNFVNTQSFAQNSTKINCIDNSTTGQTLADYFNYVHPNVLTNPTTASIEDWLQCDFTAKAGSKNIGAGKKRSTIGLNQGFTMYADNSANDVFKESNGATLKNIAWDSNLNGYVLVQKERVCQGATANTITLDSSASAVDDYYNNLFVGIVGGDGYGELFLITDYDGATKTATIDGTWATTPNTYSIYTISGTILSAVKDLGKAIKVKRNWTFADNFTALTDGQWAEFMTHVETNGKQFPTSCYSYEYSMDGVNFIQGQTADDLVSAINDENKVTDAIYGDCSQNYDEATAKNLVMRYIRVRVHIGFNIGQLGE